MKTPTFLQLTRWIFLSILLIPTFGLAVPTNDRLATAITIENLPYFHQQNTSGARDAITELSPPCNQFASASVWYKYTPVSDQTVVFDTFGSYYDTILSVWHDTSDSLTAIACNDEHSNRSQSQVIVELEQDITYYVNISGYSGESGTLILNAKSVNPLVNDDLANATEITLAPGLTFYNHTQQTQGATNEPDELVSECNDKSQASVWYQYTPLTDQRAVFDTRGSDYNTVLSVWEGSTHPLTEEILCNDDNSGSQSQVSVELAAGTTYFLNVSAAESGGGSLLEETGLLVLNMTLPPSNDYLATATLISEPLPYTNTQKTGGATIEIDEGFPSCVPDAGASVWYLFTPITDYNNVSFSTFGSSYDTVLSVWQGDNYPLTELACNNNAVTEIEQSSASQVTVPLTGDTLYYIDVGGADGEVGNLVLQVKEGETDFQIASQPQAQTIERCKRANLTVSLSTRDGNNITTMEDPVGSQWENFVALPFSYQWYQGDSGDVSIPVGTNSHIFSSSSVSQTTNYWVRINNPTGTVDSQTVTVDVAGNPPGNGIGVDATGNNNLMTQTRFEGLVTTLEDNKHVERIRQTDRVSIPFTITVDPNHVGQTADILMVGGYKVGNKTSYYMRNGNVWELWQGNMADLTAAMTEILLSDCIELTVFKGILVNLPGEFTVYVGYRHSNGDIFYNGEQVSFKVE